MTAKREVDDVRSRLEKGTSAEPEQKDKYASLFDINKFGEAPGLMVRMAELYTGELKARGIEFFFGGSRRIGQANKLSDLDIFVMDSEDAFALTTDFFGEYAKATCGGYANTRSKVEMSIGGVKVFDVNFLQEDDFINLKNEHEVTSAALETNEQLNKFTKVLREFYQRNGYTAGIGSCIHNLLVAALDGRHFNMVVANHPTKPALDPVPLDMGCSQRYTVHMRQVPGHTQKIQAIKTVRAATSLGLKEAKDLVDSSDHETVTLERYFTGNFTAATALAEDLHQAGMRAETVAIL